MQGVPEQEFRLEEATIDELHQAIHVRAHDMRDVVRQYIDACARL